MSKPTPLTLGITFFKIGLVAYGGWSGAMLMVRREAIMRHKWISEEELAKSFTYSQLLPGSTAVGIISGTGYRILGWRGLIIATIAYISPSAFMMIIFSSMYFKYHAVPLLAAPLNGVYAALVGLLLANTWQLANKHNKQVFLWVLSLTSLLVNILFNLSFAGIVLVAGFLCVLYTPKDGVHE